MPVQGLPISASDKVRLSLIYERLRTRLLDLTLRNPMLSYKHRASSKRHLRFVDAVPEEVYRLVVGEGISLEVFPLRPPDDSPKDERDPSFITELEYAKATDVEYLTALQALENTGHDDEIEIEKLERRLRDRLREKLGLPQRLDIDTINPVDHANELGINPRFELSAKPTKGSHNEPRLQTLRWPEALDAVMEKIAYDARSAEQEMGFSTLFLAFGFLEWIDSKDSSKSYFSPLLLLPVTIEAKRRAKHGKKLFSLVWSGDSANTNLSLREMLKDFHLTLPEFEEEDETIGSVEKYFNEVQIAVAGMGGWRVHRWLTLGHFNFGRFAMYDDLDPKKWPESPADHALVGSVLGGAEPSDRDGSGLMPPDDYPIDDPIIEKAAPILIHDADASQHSALIDVMKERNLVIQGPPGTGKSQTITNIIANALAKNKTVLFLSEKQAALEVVKRRLDIAGLGDFCLELHSHKSSSKHVIESLKRRHALGYAATVASAVVAQNALIQNRQYLNNYLEALGRSEPEDESVCDLIWRSLRAEGSLSDQFKAFKKIEFPNRLLDDPLELKALFNAISEYAGMCESFSNRFGEPITSPWQSLEFGNGAHQGIVSGLLDDLEQLRDYVRTMQALIAEGDDLGVSNLAQVEAIIALHQLLPTITPNDRTIELLINVSMHEVETLIRSKVEFNAANAQVSRLPELLDVNDTVLECIDKLGAAAATAGWDNLNPAAGLGRGHAEIEEASALRNLIEAFIPVIETLGFSRALPANAIESVHIAALTAQYLHGSVLEWFRWATPDRLAAFRSAKVEWTELRENDARWRERFFGYRDKAWPSADELRTAAMLLRKNILRKMIDSFSKNSRAIRALVEKMGDPSWIKSHPEKLEALAAHIEACAAFAKNEKYGNMFGAAWRAFNTKFDGIGKILDFQQQVKAALNDRPSGPEVFQSLVKADEKTLQRIGGASEAAEIFRNTSASLRQRLDTRSIETLLQDLATGISQARDVIAADPDRVTCFLDQPIRILREASVAEKERRRSHGVLLSHSLVQTHVSLIHDENAIEGTLFAIKWIATVRDTRGIPDAAFKGLLSGQCATLRSRLADYATRASTALERFSNQIAQITTRYDVRGFERLNLEALTSLLDNLLRHSDELSDFLALRTQRHTLEVAGLGALILEYEKRGLPSAQLLTLVDGIAAFKRAERIRAGSPVLRDANGSKLNQTRKLFVQQDKSKLERDRAAVRNLLIAKRPAMGSKGISKKNWTEMQLLLNEFGKEKRFVPVRDVMRRASSAVRTLKPCFMMSPLSLAKFLPARGINFDLIVIDEASQMLPEEALGALWRAKQFVVVGDQKQLPPTDFFARADTATALANDEDDIEGLNDAEGESILEVCGNVFGQPRMLRWHYRSRCESLIAFSNKEFYRDELVTFPTARPGSFSVDLVKLTGNYKKGRNPAEAQRVAEEAIRFMRKHAKFDEQNIPTIGIVAVNSQQRDLIDEELRRLKADDPDVEEYEEKVKAKGDEVFVKNLENVQGDERDFIFISLTYGPERGMQKVYQRFGPINGKNGHRRLNVLFTRARIRLVLFTSMTSADVLCEPGQSAEGVRILKAYLEYAERRGEVGGTLTGKGADSDFEFAVAERLRSRGYSVETQVGVSGYRIDLGIRHPDRPDRFIVGVECDGRAYHSSKSARDRDRLREEILRGLGWTIIRVWSTDWFDNPTLQTDRLVKEIEELRRRPVPPYEDYRIDEISEEQTSAGSNEAARETVLQSRNISVEIAVPMAPELAEYDTALSVLVVDEDTAPLTRVEVANLLRQFREDIIAKGMNGSWEPHRSIARDAMIEALIGQKLTDPDDWFVKIPGFLRAGTNPVEKNRYLEQICQIVDRLDV